MMSFLYFHKNFDIYILLRAYPEINRLTYIPTPPF